MFKEETMDWGGSYIIWNTRDKKMVREVILESFQKMKLPKGMIAKLTKVKWAGSYLKDNKLNIGVCIEFQFPIDIENSNWCKCWTSQVIHMQIPFNDFRDWKLKKIIREDV
jgi:hypothetical protein